MGQTNAKGGLGEAMIFADLQRQGNGVAIPWGHDLPFDLIVVRKEDGALSAFERMGWSDSGEPSFGANRQGASQRDQIRS